MKIKKNFFYDLLAKNISLFNNKKQNRRISAQPQHSRLPSTNGNDVNYIFSS